MSCRRRVSEGTLLGGIMAGGRRDSNKIRELFDCM